MIRGILIKSIVLLAVGAIALTACQTELDEQGTYYRCDESGNCRSGFECVPVDEQMACVPGDEADQFRDTGSDASDDTAQVDVEDTRDATADTGNTEDVRDSGPSDVTDTVDPDATTACDVDGIDVTVHDEISSATSGAPGSPLGMTITGSGMMEITFANLPPALQDGPTTNIRAGFVETDGGEQVYPEFVKNWTREPSTVDCDSSRCKFRLPAYRIGEHTLSFEVSNEEDDCDFDFQLNLTVQEPTENHNRCIFIETWLQPAGPDAELTPVVSPDVGGTHLEELVTSDIYRNFVASERPIGLSNERLSYLFGAEENTILWYRIFARNTGATSNADKVVSGHVQTTFDADRMPSYLLVLSFDLDSSDETCGATGVDADEFSNPQ